MLQLGRPIGNQEVEKKGHSDCGIENADNALNRKACSASLTNARWKKDEVAQLPWESNLTLKRHTIYLHAENTPSSL
jgi:hypothetical protein